MRQIFNLTEAVGVGEFAKIVLSDGSESFDAAAVVYQSGWAAILSNNPTLNGCPAAAEMYGEELHFSNSWEILKYESGMSVNRMIASIEDVDIHLQGVYLGNGHLYMVAGEIIKKSQDVENFIKTTYETTSKYIGIHSYHYHHGSHFNAPVKAGSKPYRIGVELEVEFKRDEPRERFLKKESNWFFCEHDGSLNSRGVEIITVPIRPMDAKSTKFWSGLINYLEPVAESWNSSRCGLHVHIGREILGSSAEERSESIGKLLYLYHHYVNETHMNEKIFGRAHAYNEHDGKTEVGAAAKLLGSKVLKDREAKERVKSSMIRRSNEDRYFDINLQNDATIEFRKGRGSINADRICLVVEYCEKMCLYAKAAHWDNISLGDFKQYLEKNVKETSPLHNYINY